MINAASCENNISQNDCNNAPIVMISKGATVAFIPSDMYCQYIFNYVRNQKTLLSILPGYPRMVLRHFSRLV